MRLGIEPGFIVSELVSMTTEQATQLVGVRLAVVDVDNTLVFANDTMFYNEYGTRVEAAIASSFGVAPDIAKNIADTYRQEYGGAEQALFQGNVSVFFPDVPSIEPDVAVLYDHMVTIDPSGYFSEQPLIRASLKNLRSAGVRVVALTSSPDALSLRILEEAGYDPAADFDDFRAFTRSAGPPKMVGALAVFGDIASSFSCDYDQTIAIGDSLMHDVAPPIKLGMLGCWLSVDAQDGYTGIRTAHITHIIDAILRAKNEAQSDVQ